MGFIVWHANHILNLQHPFLPFLMVRPGILVFFQRTTLLQPWINHWKALCTGGRLKIYQKVAWGPKGQHKFQCRVSAPVSNSLTCTHFLKENSKSFPKTRNRGREPHQSNHHPESWYYPHQTQLQTPCSAHSLSKHQHSREPLPSQSQFFHIIWRTRYSWSEDVCISLSPYHQKILSSIRLYENVVVYCNLHFSWRTGSPWWSLS